MFFFLSSLSLSENPNDLVPPFMQDLSGNVGTWVFAGSVMVMNDHIMLTPPVQNKFGCAWNRVELPGDNWGLKAKFRIHKGTGGGGFAFWFIDNYGNYGSVHGGPETYRGLMVSATVKEYFENNTHELLFHIVENNGAERVNISLLEPDYTMTFHHRFDIPIEISFENGEIVVKSDGNDSPIPREICRKEVNVNLKNAFLGITAASEEMTSRVDLKSVEFVFGDHAQKAKQRNAFFDKQQITGELQPKMSTVLRNPVLREMSIEIAKLNGNAGNEESTAQHLLEIIGEMNEASFQVASFHELNDFIVDEILPYSQKWHRRTIKIVEGVRNARDIMGSAWNYTNMLLESFNTTLKNNLFHTSTNIMSLSEELLGISNPDNENNNSTIVIDLSNEGMSADVIITYIVLIEIVVVLIYFLLKRGSDRS